MLIFLQERQYIRQSKHSSFYIYVLSRGKFAEHDKSLAHFCETTFHGDGRKEVLDVYSVWGTEQKTVMCCAERYCTIRRHPVNIPPLKTYLFFVFLCSLSKVQQYIDTQKSTSAHSVLANKSVSYDNITLPMDKSILDINLTEWCIKSY